MAHLTSVNSQYLLIDGLIFLGTFLVFSGTVVSLLFGWIGAYIGRLVYRNRERSAQNRILYHAIRLGMTEIRTRTAASSEGSSLNSAPDAAASEASRRAAIAADMERAYRQARLRRSRRNGVALGAALILATAALVLGSQVYAGETNARQQQSTTIERQQTASVIADATQKTLQGTATAKAERTADARSTASAIASALIPYTAHVPGPCAPGALEWSVQEASSTTCAADGFTVREVASQSYVSEVMFNWPSHGFTSHYTVAVTVSSLLTSTCAGLMTNVQSTTAGSIGYEICHDGTWRIIRYDNTTGKPTVLVSRAAPLASTNRLQATVYGSRIQFMLNGATIWTLTDNPYTTTNAVYLYVDAYNGGAGAATFSDFRCALLP
ncbi:MAG: hypothetical protein KGO05_13295 [Chloroflexota bacterium]|nr:hypothetical protein [Chloroflexota bacterium]